jgi:rRNA-processing protein FCF1
MEYEKIDKDTYKVVQEPILVDLKKLKEEKLALEQTPKEPNDKELLEWAKQNHPHYMISTVNKELIEKLDKQIKEIESYG